MAEIVSASVVAVDSAVCTTGVGTPSILITHHLWTDWTLIASERLVVARAARVAVGKAQRSIENWAVEFEKEQRASLVAVAGSAHALDALYGAIRQFSGASSLKGRPSRHQYIREAISNAYKLSLQEGKTLRAEFTWLFALRDSAVHYREGAKASEPHPVEGHGSDVAAAYSVESANRAFDFLISVLSIVASPEKAKNTSAEAYASNAKAICQGVLADAIAV